MNIYESINAIMGEIGAIGKSSKNATQGFMYRGIDAVMNAINPALVKYKVFVVPEILEQTREERQTTRGGNLIYSICKIRYTFYAEDGSSVSAIVIGEGMDSGDKATNKAMSIAFKYACFQVFCIPTEEMKDPDAESYEVKAKDNVPSEEEMARHGEEKISNAKIVSLTKKCTDEGVPIERILELCKISSLSDMKEKQLSNIINNWSKVKEQ